MCFFKSVNYMRVLCRIFIFLQKIKDETITSTSVAL